MKRVGARAGVLTFLAAAGLAVSIGFVGACEQKGGPLRIDRVEPDQGTTAGGDHVAIVGSGFVPGKTQVEVRFGRKKAEQVSIASSSKIMVVTPPSERGPTDVSLMFDNGAPFKIPAGFRYVSPATGDDVRKAFFSGQPGAGAPAPKKD